MRSSILLTFVGMAVVTYLPRALPMLILSRTKLPKWLVTWLSFFPVAVLSALLVPDLLARSAGASKELWLSLENLRLIAALPTLLVAIRTRNMFASIVTGLVSIFVLNWLL